MSSSRTIIFSSLGFLSIVPITFAVVLYFSYTAGGAHSWGIFRTDGSGNAGIVNLAGAYRDGDSLKGTFSIQTIGSATFQPGAVIIPPSSGNATILCWTVEGSAYSSNAGNIELNGPNSDVKFNPVTQKLVGYGWNNGVGKIPLGDGVCFDDTTTIVDTSTGSSGFIGRVKVIGNKNGSNIYDTLYSAGVRFDTNLFNTSIQRIRKNVTMLSRNISDTYKNINFNTSNALGNKLFFLNTGTAIKTVNYSVVKSVFSTNTVQSLVMVGGNLVIDADIINTGTLPKSILLLKNDVGVGGDIYVKDSVKKIQSSLIMEGTLYSGESPTYLYNDTPEKVAALSGSQLYILGSLLSRNTIGGASKSADSYACPYNFVCDFEMALRYDLNYFRAFQSGSTANRAYKDATLDAYSTIIEYDSRVSSNPPPGLE